jgi:hypothetical protein
MLRVQIQDNSFFLTFRGAKSKTYAIQCESARCSARHQCYPKKRNPDRRRSRSQSGQATVGLSFKGCLERLFNEHPRHDRLVIDGLSRELAHPRQSLFQQALFLCHLVVRVLQCTQRLFRHTKFSFRFLPYLRLNNRCLYKRTVNDTCVRRFLCGTWSFWGVPGATPRCANVIRILKGCRCDFTAQQSGSKMMMGRFGYNRVGTGAHGAVQFDGRNGVLREGRARRKPGQVGRDDSSPKTACLKFL